MTQVLTLSQCAQRVGITGSTSALAIAEVLGMWPTFTLKQLSAAILSGMAPRPFYIIGHNTNSLDEVRQALAAGANAVEIDVNVYESRPDQLCVSETGTLDTDKGGDDDAPALPDFLAQLHGIAQLNPQNLALVIFDCKPKVATPEHGRTLLDLARRLLTFDSTLSIIISVASLDERSIFDQIRSDLGPREGLMVDEENDPEAIISLFSDVANACYGNGVAPTFQSPTLSPHVRPSLERASAFRTAAGKLKFVYAWTVGDEDALREYLRIGVNGIIPGKSPSRFDADMTATLRRVITEEEFRPKIRLALRRDNPFGRPDTAYALQVHTGTVHNAGTDANLLFTLTGPNGSVSKAFDASLIGSLLGKTPGRMENNAWDYVFMESLDLGPLQSITVRRDDKGNAPDWYLDRVTVASERYGERREATFGCWVGEGGVTRPLV
ncbi:PLAT/LH2 domain-containing protein [Piscinibacter terrae]|uniref:PLAT domain-containing protein n=1 Tax=Piscinibacter terrae TaxID=2496871 RepID=A0A3N7J195_9BURK|nr:PLAT/LH2 domain-containing protein [Albitalea terrae]RQP24722.1 hypothetical protein DZC73_07455 [Albitalea terrae]